jgi:dienelactone hydrolase
MPPAACPLAPEVLGVVRRDGYAIERLIFQSRPGVFVTANLYRPDPVSGRAPAVVCVHGHWPWARMDPHVQTRCIGLAKLGYLVLSLDAFGAGERAIEPGPGTYHGALVGASLWPVGTPLFGLQVYDNRRAVDYLISRSEVDPSRLAITGASGGGNQSLYAGATDTRLAAVVPVCGIGTYDAYLASACCVCEVNVGGAAYAQTGDVLALVAPRALLVISATRDARQFSVGEATKSIAYARELYGLMGHEDKIRHVAVESGHDYTQAMREAMYGWLEKWLRGRGDGRPVAEPAITIEEIETLRCYPAGTVRPRTIMTIPEFAAREGRERLASLPRAPGHREHWNAESARMRSRLRDPILGAVPREAALEFQAHQNPQGLEITIVTEQGIHSRALARFDLAHPRGTAIVIAATKRAVGNADFRDRSELEAVQNQWRKAGLATLELSRLRGTGPWLDGIQPIAGVPDHTGAEWGLWVGRPLLGQWVWEIGHWLDLLDLLRQKQLKVPMDLAPPERPFVLIALGAMSVPAIVAAALDDRIAGVACTDCLVSFVGKTGRAWTGVPMGLATPNILDAGDIGQLAALIAPRRLVITSGVEPDGGAAGPDRLSQAFEYTRAIYRLLGASAALTLGRAADVDSLLPGA